MDRVYCTWIDKTGYNHLTLQKDDFTQFIAFNSDKNYPDFHIDNTGMIGFSSFKFTNGAWFVNFWSYMTHMRDNMTIESCQNFIDFMERNTDLRFTKYTK